jgi:carbamoyl-phosphate synthase large subunit
MNILITGVGGPTPRSFSIALKKFSRYKMYELIATDINPLSMGLYQTELFSKSYLIPRCTDDQYWEKIEEIVKIHQIELAVILPELEVMEWCKRAEEGKLPCKALLPGSEIAGLLVDKAQMTDLLDSLGLVPPSVEFNRDTTDFANIFAKLGQDFWVRSSSGTSGLGSLRVDGEESLKNWVQINPGVKTFLASKFLPGRNLACKLLYFNGNLIRSACAERVNYIMAKVAPSGITGNTSFGRLLNEPKLVEVSTKAMNELFRVSGSPKHGFFTVDFKEDADGTPYITEVNVRHVAFTQCFAAGGANFAEDTIRIMDDDPSFEYDYKMYEFEKGLIFLRDVDSLPILMREENLLALS